MLEGVVAGDLSSLKVDDVMIPVGEYLMHIEMTIALLQSELEA